MTTSGGHPHCDLPSLLWGRPIAPALSAGAAREDIIIEYCHRKDKCHECFYAKPPSNYSKGRFGSATDIIKWQPTKTT